MKISLAFCGKGKRDKVHTSYIQTTEISNKGGVHGHCKLATFSTMQPIQLGIYNCGLRTCILCLWADFIRTSAQKSSGKEGRQSVYAWLYFIAINLRVSKKNRSSNST